MPLTVEQITVIQADMDNRRYLAAADGIIKKNADMAASGEGSAVKVVASQEGVKRAVLESARAYDRAKSSIDPYYKAELDTEKAVRMHTLATRAGISTEIDRARTLTLVAEKIQKVADAEKTRAAAQKAAEVTAYANAFDQLHASLNKNVAAAQDLARVEGVLEAAVSSGARSRLEAFSIMEQYTAGLQAATRAEQLASANRGLARMSGAASAFDVIRGQQDPALAAQQRVDAVRRAAQAAVLTGYASQPEADTVVLKAQAEEAKKAGAAQAQANAQAAASYNQLHQALNPAARAAADLAKAQKTVNDAIATGHTNAADGAELLRQYADAAAMAGQQVQKAGASAGQAQFALRQFGIQSVQGVSGILTGQSFMTVLLQQGHQLVDVSLATGVGFKQTASAVGSFLLSINPYVIAVTAAVGITTALVAATESYEKRLGRLANSFVSVSSGFRQMAQDTETVARRLARTTGLGTDEARTAAQTINASPRFEGGPERLEAMTKAAHLMALGMGVEIPAAATAMASAIEDPAKAVQDAVGKWRGFTQAMADSAQRSQDQGDRAKALTVYMDGLAKSFGGVQEHLTPLSKAWSEFTNMFATGEQNVGGFMANAGKPLADFLTNILHLITGATEALRNMYNATPDWAKSALGAGFSQVIPGMGAARALYNAVSGSQASVPGGIGAEASRRGVVQNDGAIGMFQLRAAAAKDVGLNDEGRLGEASNILGGVKYFRQQLDAMQNIDDATRAYNQGLHGAARGGGGDYLGFVKGQRAGALPGSAGAGIDSAIAEVFTDRTYAGMMPQIRERIAQIAMQESGGRHFRTGGGSAGMLEPPGEPAAGSGRANAGLNDAMKQVRDIGLQTDAVRKLRDQQQALVATKDSNGDADGRLSSAIKKIDDQIYAAAPHMEQRLRTLKDETDLSGAMTEGDRRRLTFLQQIDVADRANTETTSTSAERAKALSLEMEKLSNEYKNISFNIDQATEQQNRLNASYEQGWGAVQKVTAANSAYNAVSKIIPTSDPRFGDEVRGRTDKNVTTAQGVAAGEFEKKVLAGKDSLTLLKLETETIGMNYDARQRLISAKKTELELDAAGVAQGDPIREKYIRNAEDVRAASEELSKAQAGMDAVANSVTSAFDTIGNSITQSLLNGTGAAINWRNVMTSVAQQVLQSFLKLAVIQPILNAALGQNGATFGNTPLGGGFLNMFSGFGGGSTPSVPATVAHIGGLPGFDSGFGQRMLPANDVAAAPRFHSGLGADEFAAVLQRGERVLTARQSRGVAQTVDGLSNGGGARVIVTINTPDADSFVRSKTQVANAMRSAMNGAARKTGSR